MSAHPTPSELTEEPTRSLDAMTCSPGVIGWWVSFKDGEEMEVSMHQLELL